MSEPRTEAASQCPDCERLGVLCGAHTAFARDASAAHVIVDDHGVATGGNVTWPAPQPPDVARAALADVMSMTVDHLDDPRMRIIHKAASRGVDAAPQPPSPACTCDGDPEYCFAHAAAAPQPLDVVTRIKAQIMALHPATPTEVYSILDAALARLSRKEPRDD